jgi:hypothetical protein
MSEREATVAPTGAVTIAATGSIQSARRRAARRLAALGIGLMAAGLSGCLKTDVCDFGYIPHSGDGGRTGGAVVELEYEPVTRNGKEMWKVTAIKWSLHDINWKTKTISWLKDWAYVFGDSLFTFLQGATDPASAAESLASFAADMYSFATKHKKDVSWSSEDNRSWIHFLFYERNGRTLFTHDYANQNGNADIMRGKQPKVYRHTFDPPIYTPKKELQLYYLYYADQRGLDGSNKDGWADAKCNGVLKLKP